VLFAAAAYLLFALVMVYSATRPEQRKPFDTSPSAHGLSYEEVGFSPRGGTLKLQGWLIPGTATAPYLIFVHGINSQRTNAQAVDLAAGLVQKSGYNVLMFDLRAHGTSEGDRVTAGQEERFDVLGAYDFAVSRGAEPGRIGLIGHSYGAGLAIMAAALEPGITAVVADSPFSNVEDKAAREIAIRTPIPEPAVSLFMPAARIFADVLYGIGLSDLSPEQDAARLGFPILVIHGEADTRTPVSQGRRVHAAAPAESELWTIADVEHVQAFKKYPDEYALRVTSYLASRLKPAERALVQLPPGSASTALQTP
jgi:pimeloyl-ACP methyl ester carboxylesterase